MVCTKLILFNPVEDKLHFKGSIVSIQIYCINFTEV